MMMEKQSQRKQELQKISKELLVPIWKQRVTWIAINYQKNKEVVEKEFLDKMEGLLQKWIQYKEQEELRYIVISPLSSSVITESYELQIALYNEKLYAEENPLCFYWRPPILYQGMEEDLKAYRESAEGKIIRLSNAEVYEIKRKYAICHDYLMMFYMNQIVEKVPDLPSYPTVHSSDIKILYGTYMEKLVELGKA